MQRMVSCTPDWLHCAFTRPNIAPLFQEALENCQTRLAKMEMQQQQMVAVEGLENANARALLGKLINLLLSVLAVILVFVSTASGMITPLTKTPVSYVSVRRWFFCLLHQQVPGFRHTKPFERTLLKRR